jgi:hypothetical protein
MLIERERAREEEKEEEEGGIHSQLFSGSQSTGRRS